MLDKILINLINDLTGQSVNWVGLTAYQRSLVNTYRSEIEKLYLPREQVEAALPAAEELRDETTFGDIDDFRNDDELYQKAVVNVFYRKLGLDKKKGQS